MALNHLLDLIMHASKRMLDGEYKPFTHPPTDVLQVQ